MSRTLPCALACLLLTVGASAQTGWPNYGNDSGGTRYSGAKQIDRSNVGGLQVAWTYRTGALEPKTELIRKATFEATPILVEDKLYLSTPYNHALALDPQSGKLLWEYTMDYAGNATPATYMIDGKQYLVIATSSAHNPKKEQGARYVAFTLP